MQIMGSEVGVVDIPNWDIASKGRLMPGNIFLVDFDAGRVIKDEEVRLPGAAPHPYDLPFLALSESKSATACAGPSLCACTYCIPSAGIVEQGDV